MLDTLLTLLAVPLAVAAGMGLTMAALAAAGVAALALTWQLLDAALALAALGRRVVRLARVRREVADDCRLPDPSA